MEVALVLLDTKSNTSLSHSDIRGAVNHFSSSRCRTQSLLWRCCSFTLLLFQSLNPKRNNTAWLTLGLKNVILHLPDPESQSCFQCVSLDFLTKSSLCWKRFFTLSSSKGSWNVLFLQWNNVFLISASSFLSMSTCSVLPEQFKSKTQLQRALRKV